VAFLMSYPEVLEEQPNEKYVSALAAYHQRMRAIQAKSKRNFKKGENTDESQKD